MPTVAEKSVFSSSKQSPLIHKTQVLITTKEMSTSKHINIKVARQRTTSHRYAFEGTYLMISYSIGTSSKLMLWISSYAIDSVVSPLETAIEGSKRENETTYKINQAKLAYTIFHITQNHWRILRTLPTNNDARFGWDHVSRLRVHWSDSTSGRNGGCIQPTGQDASQNSSAAVGKIVQQHFLTKEAFL